VDSKSGSSSSSAQLALPEPTPEAREVLYQLAQPRKLSEAEFLALCAACQASYEELKARPGPRGERFTLP
jgi:hypothetical protein